MDVRLVLALILCAISAAHTQHQGRTFLFSYPANTFPLPDSLNTEEKNAKNQEERSDEEVIETDEHKLLMTKKAVTKNYVEKDYETTTMLDDRGKERNEGSDKVTTHSYDTIETEFVWDRNNDEAEIKEEREVQGLDMFEYTDEDIKGERNEKSLINTSLFPSYHQTKQNPHVITDHTDRHAHHHGTHHHIDHNDIDIDRSVQVKNSVIIDELSAVATDASGRKCINKVMMREETEYDEILTCDHSYDKRCHTSYITKYEPHQEQECDQKYRKVCTIEYEQKALHEVVEVCTTPFVKDCDIVGEEVCQNMYQSECSTAQIVHEVEDDVVNCNTIEEQKCEDVTEGFKTVNKCDKWPVERCLVEKKKVKKYTPHTSCRKVAKEVCIPKPCGVKEGEVQCQNKVKTVIVDNPTEHCDMEPLRTCKHVTKLVPSLAPTQECVDVPKEICARSKVNPKRVKKPSIQKWCYTPDKVESECRSDSDCGQKGFICKSGDCVEGCRVDDDCHTGFRCSGGKCTAIAGRVLLKSFTIKTLSCEECSEESEGVTLELQGMRTGDFPSGFPCSSNTLNHAGVEDFTKTAGYSRFDGSTASEEDMMGDCFEAALNARVEGGVLTWSGKGRWAPASFCVEWEDNSYAVQCGFQRDSQDENKWNMEDCKDIGTLKCQ